MRRADSVPDAAGPLQARLFLLLLVAASPALADWPCWRGAYGNGAAADCGEPIVHEVEDMRLVWLSEARTYGAYPEGSKGPNIYTGQAGPIVSEGRVFLYYFMPDGKIPAKGMWQRLLQKQEFDPTIRGIASREEFAKRYLSVTAEDVLLCCDAKTGKTLWQRNLPGACNYGGRRGAGWAGTKCGPVLTPCAENGKVFMVGNTFRVFAFDAETGETLWENNLGPKHEFMREKLKEAVEAQDNWKLPIDWFIGGHAPVIADGVVCADDEQGSLGGGGLVAFDAETGEILWRLPKGSNQYPGPVRWTHQGKTYFISGNGALIEPRTGDILWGPFGDKCHFVTISDKYLLTCVGSQWECRLVTPGKAELLWTKKLGSFGWLTPVTGKGFAVWSGDQAYNSIDLATGTKHTVFGELVGSRSRASLLYTDGAVLMEYVDILHLADNGTMSGAESKKGDLAGHPGLSTANTTTGCIDDGFWYVRLHDNIACFQLRRNLHPKVDPVKTDVPGLLALVKNEDPAVRVDAVEALARTGDTSGPVIDALLGCFDNPRFGTAEEAVFALQKIDPPPPALVALASGENREKRRLALRALSKLEVLSKDALLAAAADRLCPRRREAAAILKEQCAEMLPAVTEKVILSRDRSDTKMLYELVAANINEKNLPGVLDVMTARLHEADPSAAANLMRCVSKFGSDPAWALIRPIVEDPAHKFRLEAIHALAAWKGKQPLPVLKRIAEDKDGEEEAIRRAAMFAVIPILTQREEGKTRTDDADTIASYLPMAEEFGVVNQLFTPLANTRSWKAFCILSPYLKDLAFRGGRYGLLATMTEMEKSLKPAVTVLTAESLVMLKNLDDDALREKILGKMRLNKTPLKPAVTDSLAELLDNADSIDAPGYCKALAELGSADAWKLLEPVCEDKAHKNRKFAIEALGYWPGKEAGPVLDRVLADTANESKALRAAAFKAGLTAISERPMEASKRVSLLSAKLAQAREFDAMPAWLSSLGRTGAIEAIAKLGNYVNDKALGGPAADAIEECSGKLQRTDLLQAAQQIEALADKVDDDDNADILLDVVDLLEEKNETLPPALKTETDALPPPEPGIGELPGL